jgi:hypothetical protein
VSTVEVCVAGLVETLAALRCGASWWFRCCLGALDAVEVRVVNGAVVDARCLGMGPVALDCHVALA